MPLPTIAPYLPNTKDPADIRRAFELLWQAFQGSQNAVLSGNGSPENIVTAPVGTLYRRLDGGAATTLYVKETGTGNTGWTAK